LRGNLKTPKEGFRVILDYWTDDTATIIPAARRTRWAARTRYGTGAYDAPSMETRETRMAHAGWTQNLIQAGRLRAGERVLVVVDEPLAAEGAELLAAVQDVGAHGRLELWTGERPLAKAPQPVLDAAEVADLSLFLAEKPLPEEGAARFALLQTVAGHGGRQIFLGFVDGELLRGELSEPGADLERPARQLLAQLEGSETIHVRGRAGTDLSLRVEGRPWLSDALPLQAGKMANYPGGEVFVAPHADGADGVLVADLTVPYTVEGLVDKPVTLRFERGRVTSIEGGKAAEMLRAIVEEAGPGGDVIAELGIGFNPSVSPRGHVMLDEKAAGTAHVAIGRNTGPYGGDNEASIHVDCIFAEPEIEVDGTRIELPA
jgi:leucyl aminopeptidase (aminopeptidase T)